MNLETIEELLWWLKWDYVRIFLTNLDPHQVKSFYTRGYLFKLTIKDVFYLFFSPFIKFDF